MFVVEEMGASVQHPRGEALRGAEIVLVGLSQGAVGKEPPVREMEPESGIGGGFGLVAEESLGGDGVGLPGEDFGDHHEMCQEDHGGSQDPHDHQEGHSLLSLCLGADHRLSSSSGFHFPKRSR